MNNYAKEKKSPYVKHVAAVSEWQAVSDEATRLGYDSHARDLAPLYDASTRSIKIRTGKLARFIKAVTQ